MRTTVTSLLAVLLLLGCGSSTAGGVRVSGPQSAMIPFAGEWEGEYEGEDTANIGTLHFSIDPERGTSTGEVIVTTGMGKHPVPLAQLTADGENLTGQLVQYVDAGCNCDVVTKFVGQLDGVVIVGTWTTQPVGSDRVFTGRWRASRKAE